MKTTSINTTSMSSSRLFLAVLMTIMSLMAMVDSVFALPSPVTTGTDASSQQSLTEQGVMSSAAKTGMYIGIAAAAVVALCCIGLVCCKNILCCEGGKVGRDSLCCLGVCCACCIAEEEL